jgi:hypothetical protein
VVQNESLTRKNQSLEREISEQKAFLSKELNSRTDESLTLMRNIDILTSDLKKLTAHSLYLETSKTELESKLLDLQKSVD